MSLIRRPPARSPQSMVSRAWWLAGIADPAWLAVALTVAARALGVRDPARALISTLALVPDDARMTASDPRDATERTASRPTEAVHPMASDAPSDPSTAPAGGPDDRGAGADDEIDLTGGTGRTGTSTGGLVDGGMTAGPTTTGTSAPAGAATSPYPEQPGVPSTGAQGGTGKGRSPLVGNGGLDGSSGADDLETPALATDEAGGD